MRFVMHDEHAEMVLLALQEKFRSMVDKATSYTFDLTRPEDLKKYEELRAQELNMARAIHVFQSQRENDHPLVTPLAHWEIELLSGNPPKL